jgi:hypothetical protein
MKEDFLTEYSKRTYRKNMAIVMAAFVFALGINAFIFNTDAGARLQSSIADYGTPSTKGAIADLSLKTGKEGSDIINLSTNTSLSNVNEIRVTFLFDASAVKFASVFSKNNQADLAVTSSVDGVMLVIVRFQEPTTLSAGENILSIVAKKTKKELSVINLAETQFISDNKIYQLSNTPLEF